MFRSEFDCCPTDGGRIVSFERDPLEGAALAGQYQIEAYIGEGAMGRIYRAHRIRLEARKVAIKILFGDVACTDEMRLRFAHEAEAASRLSDPHVVAVSDFGVTDDGLLYLVMDLAEGPTLSDLIAGGPMPWRTAVGFARQLCLGLEHAHGHGLVHRDLKPANVVVGGGIARIVDFGLALNIDPALDRTRLTATGATVGTPIYAAPEQQLGNGVVDHRADLFSVGVTLFEMLAGTCPFDGAALEVICQNAMADRPAIAARAPGVVVPAELEQVVRRLMAAKPEDRFGSARAVIAALDQVTAPSPHGQRGRWGVRVAIGGAATAALVAGIFTMRAQQAGGTGAIARSGVEDGGVVVATAPIDAAALSSVQEDAMAADPGAAVATAPDAAVATDPDVAIVAPPDVPVVAPPDLKRSSGSSRHPKRPTPARPRPAAPRPGPRPGPATPEAARPDASVPKIVAPEVRMPELTSDPPQPAALPSPVDPAPGPRPPTPTPTPSTPSPVVSLAQLVVRGSLAPAVVNRALERVLVDLRGCRRAVPSGADVVVHASFTVDESGRTVGVHASGGAAELSACVAASLGRVRTASVPDVGTVAVELEVGFRGQVR
jgi:eukaryotic-like serine/threonine-protein kinase